MQLTFGIRSSQGEQERPVLELLSAKNADSIAGHTKLIGFRNQKDAISGPKNTRFAQKSYSGRFFASSTARGIRSQRPTRKDSQPAENSPIAQRSFQITTRCGFSQTAQKNLSAIIQLSKGLFFWEQTTWWADTFLARFGWLYRTWFK